MNLQLFALAHKTIIMADDGGGSPTKKEDKKPVTNKVGGFDPNSLVDYLKMNGEDSSYSARAVIADELGITNYKGSGEQNTQLLKMLKNGATSKPVVPEEKPKAEKKDEKKDKKKDEKKEEPKAEVVADVPVVTAPAVTEPASGINGVSSETMQALNTPFSPSSAYIEAMNYTNSLLEKLSSGRTSYTDQIKDMMNQIQNRDKFSYDVDTDMLFQQALASSMASGQQAMQDTIGQASALTGGYASTYATSAGNQAYNSYIQDAYNNLPEYYQMALEAYNMEGQDMYNQLSMLSDADATEYGRMYDSWNAHFTNTQNMYNQEYGAWQDNWNNNYNMATLGNSNYWSGVDNQYRYDALEQNQNQFDTSTYWDNYWSEKDDTYRNDALEQNRNQFETSTYWDNYWNEKDETYRNDALAQDKALADRDYLAKYDLNGDNIVNEADRALEEASSYDKLTNSEIEELKQIYIDNGGGEKGDEAVARKLSLLGKNNVDAEALFNELNALEEWTISKDTINWFGGNENEKYTKLNGTVEMSYLEIVSAIKNSDMTEEEKAEAIRKLDEQNKR